MSVLEPNPDRVILGVPGKTSYLELIRRVVSGTAHHMGFDEDEIAKIEMAVDEACANVIEHGYGAIEEEPPPSPYPTDIDLYVIMEADHITITIADHARPFNPCELPLKDPDDYMTEGRGRGLGIYIMNKFMDEVKHSPLPEGGNELRLVKYLRPMERCV